MDCPYCNKVINALTGLQEIQKFQKHLQTCKKHPDRKDCPLCNGEKKVKSDDAGSEGLAVKCWYCNGAGKVNPPAGLKKALEVRAESGQ